MVILISLWLLAAVTVAVLALRRLALTWHDHLILKAHPANFEVDHIRLRGRIAAVDQWGEVLTIAILSSGIALVIFVAYGIFKEAIRKLEQLLRLL